jgi:hypothetical protein
LLEVTPLREDLLSVQAGRSEVVKVDFGREDPMPGVAKTAQSEQSGPGNQAFHCDQVIIATSGGVCSGRLPQAFPECSLVPWWLARHSFGWTVRIFHEPSRIAPLMSRISACFAR